MLIIDGKRVTDAEIETKLADYDKVVTLELKIASHGRLQTNGQVTPSKPKVNIPMSFTVNDPNKGGRTVKVVYSKHDDIPIDGQGVIDPKWSCPTYSPPARVTKLHKSTDSELILALAYHSFNTHNILYDGHKTTPSSSPLFTLAKKGAAVRTQVNKDEMQLKVLGYLIGEKKVSDKKVHDIYKQLGFEADLIENEDFTGMRVKVTEYAKSNPEKFIELVEDTMYDMKARVVEAFEKGILVCSDSRKITWGDTVEGRDSGKTICQFKITENKVDAFCEYLVKKDISGTDRDTLLEHLELSLAVN